MRERSAERQVVVFAEFPRLPGISIFQTNTGIPQEWKQGGLCMHVYKYIYRQLHIRSMGHGCILYSAIKPRDRAGGVARDYTSFGDGQTAREERSTHNLPVEEGRQQKQETLVARGTQAQAVRRQRR